MLICLSSHLSIQLSLNLIQGQAPGDLWTGTNLFYIAAKQVLKLRYQISGRAVRWMDTWADKTCTPLQSASYKTLYFWSIALRIEFYQLK